MAENRRRLGWSEWVHGKWFAARTLADFVRTLENWREVWSAYRLGTPPPPLRLRGGLTIHHEPDDDLFNLFREIYCDRCYTAGGFYRPRPGDVVVDLGANVGFFALFLEWMARGVVVHAFEPGPETRQRLEHNVRSNGLERFVAVHPFAVSDRAGSARLRPAGLLAQRSLFDNEFNAGNDASGDEVECVSLSDAVDLALAGKENGRVALLKMDIEGAEIEAVEGTPRAVWDRVERVAFEYHDRFRPGCRSRVVEALRGYGFTRFDELREGYQLNDVGIVLVSRCRAAPASSR